MKVLRQIFDFYINSSIHVSFSVVALTWITLLEFDSSGSKNILLFNFFASITGYNFVKYFGLARFHHRSLATWLQFIQVFSFFCFVLMCYYAFQIELETLFYIAGFGLITFFYAIPLLPKHFLFDEKKNLRSVGGIKIYVIALVWAGVTVFLPLIDNYVDISENVFISSVQRFVFVIALMLPFEIRDMQYDSIRLSTVPQNIGMKWTKIIGVILLVLFYWLEYLKNEVNPKKIVTLLITLVTLSLLIGAKKNQGKYYSAFWVEGIPILWLLLLLLF